MDEVAMANCPSCGRPLGFFKLNWQQECGICGKAICYKCREWEGAEWLVARCGIRGDGMGSSSLCSTDCAFKFYERYIQAVPPSVGLILYNVGNVGVGLEREEPKGKAVTFSHTRSDPREHPQEAPMAPEASRLYERIKSDLSKRRVTFKEEFFGI